MYYTVCMTAKSHKTNQYWLMKSEPDCFSVDDLAKNKTEMWDGVRNYQVRNMMRDQMKVGDKALFYHSSAGSLTGVVGEMEIVREAYPDPTQFDPTLTFSSPSEVEALKRIVNSNRSTHIKIFLKSVDKNNEKVRVGVDPKSEHPDPSSDPLNPRWLCVDVKFLRKFKQPVLLSEMKLDPKLKDFTVLKKGNRLSIMPVNAKHYQHVVILGTK